MGLPPPPALRKKQAARRFAARVTILLLLFGAVAYSAWFAPWARAVPTVQIRLLR